MTCQNCGHPQERHPAIWYGSQRGRPLTSCDDCPCTVYREPEPEYPRFEEIPTTRLQRWWFRNWTLKYGRLKGVNDA